MRVKPPPSAVVSLGLETLPSSIFLSATSTVVLLTVVVVPLTVRSPLTVNPPVTATPVELVASFTDPECSSFTGLSLAVVRTKGERLD